MYDVTMQYCPLFLNNRNTNCWDTCVCDVHAFYVLRQDASGMLGATEYSNLARYALMGSCFACFTLVV